MKKDTPCYIVYFDEYTRRACLENPAVEESYCDLTFQDGRKKVSCPAYKATVGFAREIRRNGVEGGKSMSFKIVVMRSGGWWSSALANEWIVPLQRKKSHARTVKTQITKTRPVARMKPQKKSLRGRVGRLS
jgi:hypothetical protein